MPAKTGAPELKGTAWQALRRRVIAEETHCWLCHHEVDPTIPWPDPRSPAVDHVTPRSHGGDPYARDNVRLAHLGCNASRGNRPPTRRPSPTRDWFG